MKISVLGSTGSVGTQVIEVARESKISIIAISAGKNISLLKEQIREFNPKFVCVQNKKDANLLADEFKDIKFLNGIDGLKKIAALEEPEVVFNAVSGFIGIYPCLAAAKIGKKIALANKECVVSSGLILANEVLKNNAEILPLDSEHSAIWQCLGNKKIFHSSDYKRIKKIILTASGGPFLNKSPEELANVKPCDVLDHPVWKMGAKISVDSATMINKGLEIIEASYFFGIDPSKIEVLIHPECSVHSMVEFENGSILAQISRPSMKISIQNALEYVFGKIYFNSNFNLDITKANFEFYKPNPCTQNLFDFFKQSAIKGNSATCAITAADKVAVDAFLSQKIGFLDIEKIVRGTVENFSPNYLENISEISKNYYKFKNKALKLIKNL
ncbi:MAG: 1-deoxy-D-xylulose-5-phosphate reductoisomerase [Oscillospiraceae bacterium]|jgi:1-deoxy-D-xylulose-5-phosphate reductoisomerase|nr:1-deoxy-D-xylulose-5-phosphate reductoisomerase [Oscillospiraceae bacterium]